MQRGKVTPWKNVARNNLFDLRGVECRLGVLDKVTRH
jgi:hypothetical protein